LKGGARSEIQQYGDIINVLADGNCGVYSLQYGLNKLRKRFELDPGKFQKNL